MYIHNTSALHLVSEVIQKCQRFRACRWRPGGGRCFCWRERNNKDLSSIETSMASLGWRLDDDFFLFLLMAWCIPGCNIQRSKNLKQKSTKALNVKKCVFFEYGTRILAFVDCFLSQVGTSMAWRLTLYLPHRGSWYRTRLTLLGENVANRGYTTQASQAGKNWCETWWWKMAKEFWQLCFDHSLGLICIPIYNCRFIHTYIFLKSWPLPCLANVRQVRSFEPSDSEYLAECHGNCFCLADGLGDPRLTTVGFWCLWVDHCHVMKLNWEFLEIYCHHIKKQETLQGTTVAQFIAFTEGSYLPICDGWLQIMIVMSSHIR